MKILLAVLFCFGCGISTIHAQCGSITFTADKQKDCSPMVVTFIATGAGPGSTYEWNFNNAGFISGSDTMIRAFTVPGDYDVELKVTPKLGAPCIVTKKKLFKVLPTPKPTIYAYPSRYICLGSKSVTLLDTTPDVVDREWIVDGVSYKNAASSISLTFSSSGTKSVSIKVTNSAGCTGIFSDNTYLQIHDSVPVEFCGSLTISKKDIKGTFKPNIGVIASGRSISKYEWFFPGGSPSTFSGKNPPQVTWSNVNTTQDVTFKITMSDGCTYSCTRRSYIQQYIKPSVAGVKVDTTCTGTHIFMQNTAANNGRVSWEWNMPDGMIDPPPPGPPPKDINISYGSAGTYDGTLSFKYDPKKGCTQTVTYVGIITILGPSVDFYSPQKQSCDPKAKIQLENRTRLMGATGVKYTWRVYDSVGKQIPGLVFQPKNALGDTFFYPKYQRIYGISLSAKTSKCSDSVYRKEYILITRPEADFEVDTQQLCLGQSIQFTSYTNPPDQNGKTYSYIWNIQHADSIPIFMTLTGAATDFTPWVPGRYHVTLIVQNSKTCADTVSKRFVFTVFGTLGSAKADATEMCTETGTYFRGRIAYQYPRNPSPPVKYEWKVDGVSDGDSFNIINKNSLTNCYIQFWERGDYIVYLFAYDKQNCSVAIPVPDTIHVGVSSDFNLYPPKCIGDTSEIYSDASFNALSYKWSASPPDAATFVPSDTVRAPSIVYLKDTCVQVSLITTKEIDGNVCTDTARHAMCYKLPHVMVTSPDSVMPCAPVVATFNWKSTVPKTKIFWDFGDGTNLLTSSNPVSHVYKINNIEGFDIKTTAFDSNGCTIGTQTLSHMVRVNGPQPKFLLDKHKGCDGIKVQFTDASIRSKKVILFYDDDQTDTAAIHSHTYGLNDPDIDSFNYFPVLLSLDDADTACRPFYKDTITVYKTPTADFYSDTVLGCVPLTIGFHDTSRGVIRQWAWDFDSDGIIDDSSQNPRFTYKKPGTYTVTLLVMGAGGCPDAKIKKAYIQVLPIPITGFITGQHKICGKAQVKFTDTARYYKYYLFDYGDGSPLEVNAMVPHLYAYDTLKATSDSMIFVPQMIGVSAAGCSDTFTDTIIAYAVPRTDFQSDLKSGCSPLAVKFNDISTYTHRWEWDFENDGVIDDTVNNPSHIFPPGIYTVKLRTYGLNGCVDSMVKVNYIRVNEPPKAGFSADDSTICIGDEATFTDETYPNANAVKWLWIIDDPASPNKISTDKNPKFQFFTPGYRKVFLAVEDNFGCRDTIRKNGVFVEDSLPPQNSALLYVTVEGDNSIKAVWDRNNVYDFQEYILTRAETPGIEVYRTSTNTDTAHTDVDLSISTKARPYCYFLQTQDECGNVSIPSATHCTVLLTASPLSASTIRVDWTAYVGFGVRAYHIYRSGPDNNFKLLATLAGNTLTYNDSNLCDQQYCYYIEAEDLTNRFASRSNISCAQAPYVYQDNPIAMDYATVVDDKRIKVKWQPGVQPNLKNYIIGRKSGNSAWLDSFATTKDTFFTDNTANIFAAPYAYRIRTIDACGYQGPVSRISQSIFLDSRIINDKVTLSWNKYRHWNDGVDHYEVQIRDRKGVYKTTAVLSPNDSTYTDDSIYTTIDTAYCYRIIGFQHGVTLYTSMSNSTCALLDARIFIPNAFSPNRDSINDVWKVSALSIYNMVGQEKLNYYCRIVNRWGQIVFESTDVNQGWDGNVHGKPAPSDVYMYLIHAQGIDGRSLNRKGNITLLK